MLITNQIFDKYVFSVESDISLDKIFIIVDSNKF